MSLPGKDHSILYFDGVCNLCNGVVQQVIKNDRKQQFLFASLQSGAGAAAQETIKQQYGKVPDSIILYHKGKYYIKSAAALKTARLLGGAWKLLAIGYILPPFFRNIVYDWVARNRYRWFGRQDTCMMPTEELNARFLS